MPLKAGTAKSGAADSMTAAIVSAFEAEWEAAKDDPFPGTTLEMKMLFAAVARGVVQHLAANHEAFKVQITSGGNATGIVNEIETT